MMTKKSLTSWLDNFTESDMKTNPSKTPPVSYFVGVDPAYSKPTAWCIVDQDGLIVSMGKCEAGFGEVYRRAVSQLLAALPVSALHGAPFGFYAGVEGQYVYKNKHVALQLSRAAALWEAALYTVGVDKEVWRPKPAQWRAKLVDVSDKKDAIEYAGHYGWTTDDDDEAEAFCIAMATRMHYS